MRSRSWALAFALVLAPVPDARSETPGSDLARARAALEAGDAQQAKELFERILAADPDAFEAHLGLGRAYLALGEEARALIELERVLHLDDLPPDLRGRAEAYADAAQQLAQGERSSSRFHLQAGAGRYSPADGLGETFGTLGAGAALGYRWSDRYSLNASVVGSHSFYPDSGDTNAYRGRVGLGRVSGNNQTWFELTSRSRRRPSGASLSDHAASVEWQRTSDADNQFKLGAQISQVNVPDSLVGQLDRNHRAGQVVAGIEHALADGHADLSVNALLGREWARRGGIDGDAGFLGLDAELRFTVGESTSLWLGGLWRQNRFRRLRPGDEPATMVKRRDELYELFAGIAWSLPNDWSLMPEVLYLRDRGNIRSNHYSSSEYNLSLRRDF